MNSVLISIKPKWCEKIALGKKTIELRKSTPKLSTPVRCYIYCTKEKILGDFVLIKSDELKELFPNQKVVGVNKSVANDEDVSLPGTVIGEFICDSISCYPYDNSCYGCFYPSEYKDSPEYRISSKDILSSCVPYSDIEEYGEGKTLFGWHISNLTIYDTPRKLQDFCTICDGSDTKCNKCKYSYVESSENGTYTECCCNNLKPMERAPQSWCYAYTK